MNTKAVNLLGMVMMLGALILTWHWFDWKLTLVIFLVFWGNNMERYKK
jgi:hypothetical protein